MIQEFIFVAWHLKGCPDLRQWMSYTSFERAVILEEVNKRIEMHNSVFDQ